MTAAASSEPIKVCLTNKGEDTETPWAQDLGPVPNGPPGARKVRLLNVPFMHAKPTWGDVIVVTPRPEGFPTWDRDGIAWKNIGSRIVEDGGRWAMIVDYVPFPGISDVDAITALARACNAEDVVCEGAWGPRDAEPGRAYLAVQKELTAEAVMVKLNAATLPMQLIQIHPEPKKLPRAQTVVGVTSEKPRKPATDAVKSSTPPPPPKSAAASKPAPPKPAEDATPTAASSKPAPSKPAATASTKPAAAAKAAAPAKTAAPTKTAAPAKTAPSAKSAAPAKTVAPTKSAGPTKTASKAKASAKPAAPAKKGAAKKVAPAKKPAAKKAAPAKKPAAKAKSKKR